MYQSLSKAPQIILHEIRNLLGKKRTAIPTIYWTFLICLSIFGPFIAPYGPAERVTLADGSIGLSGPSWDHPLGTTTHGYDILSRVIFGTQPTLITGILGGFFIVSIGATIGITAGYLGGATDNALMRTTDLVYAIPLVPFAIVLIMIFSVGFFSSIVVIGLILWRGNARVLRSQVLQIKERPFIKAAKATGSSRRRIILKHIFPNIAPMAVLFFALGIGWSIIVQASLSFLGFTNPFVPSWGLMIRNAFESGYMDKLILWPVIPGMLICMTVLSAFMIGREFEESPEYMAE